MTGAIVFYCRPFTCEIVAHDVDELHLGTLRERRVYGGFCPRTLWDARPNCFRPATSAEIAALYHLGYHGFNVHEWCVTNAAVNECIA
jgi:hypothetical protein